jgi:predicted PurR-regulated permease PerM
MNMNMNMNSKEELNRNVLILIPLLMGGIALVYGMGRALWPMVCASYLAYLLFPFIRKLEKKGIPRRFGSLCVFSFFALISIILIGLIAPLLTKDFHQFITEIPEVFTKMTDQIESLGLRFGMHWVVDKSQLKKVLSDSLAQFSMQSFQSVTNIVSQALVSFKGFIFLTMNLFLLPIFFYFLVNDFELIVNEIKSMIPPRWNAFFKRFLFQVNEVLKGYLQGQLIVAVILSVLYSVCLYFVGIRFGVLIGCMTGFLIFIPFVGVGLGFVFSLVMALTDLSVQAPSVGGVFVVFLIIPLLEQYILTPRLVGGKVGLNSLETIIALIVGGNLLGFLGMIIAIPFWAIAKTIYKEIKQEYLKSSLFRGTSS